MENAAKALIIAASILIAVLVLSLFMYVFSTYSQYAQNIEQKHADTNVVKYYTQFKQYEDQELRIHDVLTIANLAYDFNQKHDYDNITVKFGGRTVSSQKWIDSDWIQKLAEDEATHKISQITYYDDNNIIIKEIDIS